MKSMAHLELHALQISMAIMVNMCNGREFEDLKILGRKCDQKCVENLKNKYRSR